MTGIAAAAIIALAVGATIAAFMFRAKVDQIQEQRDEIRRAERQAKKSLLESFTEQARAIRFSRQVGQRFECLRALERAVGIACELGLPPDRLDRTRDQAIACFALPDMLPTGRVIEQPVDTFMCCFDPGMNRYALRLKSGTILVRRVADDQEVARFQARGDREVFVFGFSPDGRYLTTTHAPEGTLTVWDVNRKTTAVPETDPVAGTAARFSPDSRRIALAHRAGEILIYDLETGRPRKLRSGLGTVFDLAFRWDGLQIAVTTSDSRPPNCHVLEIETGKIVRTIPLRSVSKVAWGPDGSTLATAGEDFKIDLWDAPSGMSRARLEGSSNSGLRARFHPAGKLLASTALTAACDFGIPSWAARRSA